VDARGAALDFPTVPSRPFSGRSPAPHPHRQSRPGRSLRYLRISSSSGSISIVQRIMARHIRAFEDGRHVDRRSGEADPLITARQPLRLRHQLRDLANSIGKSELTRRDGTDASHSLENIGAGFPYVRRETRARSVSDADSRSLDLSHFAPDKCTACVPDFAGHCVPCRILELCTASIRTRFGGEFCVKRNRPAPHSTATHVHASRSVYPPTPVALSLPASENLHKCGRNTAPPTAPSDCINQPPNSRSEPVQARGMGSRAAAR
jgi:hypothetical protein